MIKTDVSMVGLSSGAAFTSDAWNRDALKPYLRMTEIMTPPAHEHTEVLDICTSEEWPRLLSKMHRSWGDWSVALLWNPGNWSIETWPWNPANGQAAITLDFARAGLDPAHHYAVWSFWDDKFLGIARGQWTTPPLPGGGCQHLVLTDLDAQHDKPVFIGSNLHIYCGAAEIKNFQPSSTGIKIGLTDAGARDGELFIHSKRRLVAGQASGCSIAEVAPAGGLRGAAPSRCGWYAVLAVRVMRLQRTTSRLEPEPSPPFRTSGFRLG